MSITYYTDPNGKRCVDLRASFGAEYAVTLDPYEPEDIAWNQEVIGEWGKVYPYGGDLLVAVPKTYGAQRLLNEAEFATARKKKNLYSFPAVFAEAVFEIIKAGKKAHDT